MDHAVPIDESALTAGQTGAPTPAVSADDLSWAVVAMRAGERIVVNAALIAAYQAASSPHSIRALRSDLERSEEHTSELQSLMRISYAVFCLKKKKNQKHNHNKTSKQNTTIKKKTNNNTTEQTRKPDNL